MYATRIAAVAVIAVTIAGCEKKDVPVSQARPVHAHSRATCEQRHYR